MERLHRLLALYTTCRSIIYTLSPCSPFINPQMNYVAMNIRNFQSSTIGLLGGPSSLPVSCITVFLVDTSKVTCRESVPLIKDKSGTPYRPVIYKGDLHYSLENSIFNPFYLISFLYFLHKAVVQLPCFVTSHCAMKIRPAPFLCRC
jgi:hypothetical protein